MKERYGRKWRRNRGGGGECGKVRKKVERKQRFGGGNVETVNEEESGEKE